MSLLVTDMPRTLRVGADQSWAFQRTADGSPLIPTRVRAQVRSEPGGAVWLTGDSETLSGTRITIDAETGWIYFVITKDDASGDAWLSRRIGVWDAFVEISGEWQPWVAGLVYVTHNVTEEEA